MNHQNNPLVSVIVPVYNVEQYLDECLYSIRQQTYENLEIIVVEDCSTDKSLEVLSKHLNDQRIKLIRHEKNSGLSAARNTGIDAAKGDYIMFVDSDDHIHNNLIQLCLDNTSKKELDLIVFDFQSFYDGIKIDNKLNKNKKYESKIFNQSEYLKYHHFAWLKFLRADILRNNILRFPVGYYYEDWPFHWELAFNNYRVLRLSAPLYYYRLRSGSITSSGDQKLIHIYYSHRVILEKMRSYDISLSAKIILARKIYDGLWFVLTQIKFEYLNQAILEAKNQLKITNNILKLVAPSLKVRILILGIKMPNSMSAKFISLLRFSLNLLSSSRREANKS